MALLRIITRNDLPAYSQRVELDGAIYTLVFRYNERKKRWIMDIQDEEETDILIGIPLLTGVPLLLQYTKEGLPPGDFILLDRQDLDRNAERNDLGNSKNLFYQEGEFFE